MISRNPGEDSQFLPDPQTMLLTELRNRISSKDYETWFRDLPCRFYPPSRFVLTAPNGFRRAWLEKNFRDLLQACARSLVEGEACIEFEVRNDPKRSLPGASMAPTRRPAPSQPAPPSSGGGGGSIRVLGSLKDLDPSRTARPRAGKTTAPPPEPLPLHPDFTFEHLVVGTSNRVAHAAAIAVSESPGTTYNPLFIHGEPGVGKTHLLHALCHRLQHSSRLKVTYLTAVEFLQRFTQSVRESAPDHHQAGYLQTDVLVIDDVHFLAAKEKTQLELLAVFNSLMDSHKQIVLSSRAAPRNLVGIQDRLCSRFQSGLVACLESPGLDTRIAVLLRKARLRGFELSTEIAEYIASLASGSVRELEGALLRVINHAGFHGSTPTLTLAREALEDTFDDDAASRSVTMRDILRVVQDYYQVKAKALISRSKARSIALPRQVAVFLARQLTPLSLQEIGFHLGGRDHTTVLYSEDRITKLRASDAKIRADLQNLQTRLLSQRLR